MKKTSQLIIVITILSCSSKDTLPDRQLETRVISIVRDVTDDLLLAPKADPILQLFACDQHPDDAIRLRHRELGDKIHSEVTVFNLSNTLMTKQKNRLDDPKFRKREILVFYDKVRNYFNATDTQKTAQSLRYSECLLSIASELCYLAKDSSTEKKLLVFSDLKENSTLLNVYKNGIPSKQEFEIIIERHQLFPRLLGGIEVFFIYRAHSREEEKLFNGMVSLYEQIIVKRGGKVVIQASNDTFVQ